MIFLSVFYKLFLFQIAHTMTQKCIIPQFFNALWVFYRGVAENPRLADIARSAGTIWILMVFYGRINDQRV
jgi:hypothetical protein